MSGAVRIFPPNKALGGKWYVSQAAEEFKQIVTGKGVLHHLTVLNTNAAARVAWLFDNTASSGTVLYTPIPLPLGVGFYDLTLLTGVPFTKGLRVASSSTAATFTASGAADFIITAGYVLSVTP